MKRHYRNFVMAKWAVFYGVATLLALRADAWCWLTFILTWIASAWVERYGDMLKMAKVIDLLVVTQEQAVSCGLVQCLKKQIEQRAAEIEKLREELKEARGKVK